MISDRTDPDNPGPPPPARAGGGWGVSLALGLALAAIYLGNRAEPVGEEDTIPAQLIPLAIVRGDGPFLDRFAPILERAGTDLAWSMTRSRGHLVSRYAPGPVLVQVPFVAIQVAIRDRLEPGWDGNPGRAWVGAFRMSKVASALIGALTAVALHRLLRRLGVGPMAVPATLAAALGSDLWVVGSQAPWEHGPAALALTLAMLFLTPRPAPRAGLLLGGLAAAILVWCRPLDLIFAVAILLRVAAERPRALAWFLPAPIVLGSALVAYNVWFFGSIAGGHAQIEALHPVLHGVEGAWSGHLLDGMAGTLLSPNRGLLVFCPWIIVALATLPATFGRLRAWPPGVWLLGALGVDLLVLSKYAIWWGGHCFGPRYWTDAIPIFAVLLGLGLDWARARCHPLVAIAALTIVLSVAIQAIGAICYPSSWNGSPADVDRRPGRTWDWSDGELHRCLREGVRPWTQYRDRPGN